MPEIAVNGTVLHYEEAGEGPPLLLLHGGGGTALLHYKNEIPLLAKRYHVIAPDFRGYGQSSPPRDFPAGFYQRDAADMAALIEALGIAPAHLCGWSDGGITALLLAADYPWTARTLAVWGAEAYIKPEERAGWDAITDWQAWPEHTRERFIAAQGPLNWPGVLERMKAGYILALESGGNIVADRLNRVACPTLILHGDADEVVPVAHAHELHAAIRGSALRIFPGGHHALHRDRHDELLVALLDFLQRHEGAEPATHRKAGNDAVQVRQRGAGAKE
jgi:valacyclovir hydrolase